MRHKTRLFILAVAVLTALAASLGAQMNEPKIVTLTGKIIDVTCAVKHKAMTDSWHNAENNKHLSPEGVKPKCAEMCLRGGQPAGLFVHGRIEAALACNPRLTLADYAAEEVELEGFWGGGRYDKMQSFVPLKIRRPGESDWTPVNCLTMHAEVKAD